MSTRFRHVVLLAVVVVFFAAARTAYAQDALARAKGFYESADYEEALQLLESLKGKPSNTEAAAYRVFCLVALGRRDEAKAAVESIVKVDPLYRPTNGQVSPRLRSFFEDIRKPLLPEIARQSYAIAKAQFDAKNWAPAIAEFDRVLSLLGEIGNDAGASDLRTLAVGFRDLARAATEPPPAPKPEPPAPKPTPAPLPVKPAEPEIYGVEHADVKRPTALSKEMPVWVPGNATEERASFVGALELVINDAGKVVSVKLIDGVHPRYDPALIKAAAGWTFRPATKNGVPVKYRYTIAVQLGK
jgi:tetratricopeptide (TPR) repeat protein